jgi:esterase/lipase superfamily enzyme
LAVTATALADLRFGLQFAAKRYRQFAELRDPSDNARLFLSLADERSGDAHQVDAAATSAGFAHAQATIDDDIGSSLLGLGTEKAFSATSAAYRVQRAENTLRRMAAQLESLVVQHRIRAALNHVRNNIEKRRGAVREARRKAQQFEGLFSDGSSRAEATKSAEGVEVVVWFGTNRRKDELGHFLGERGSDVSYGLCRVFVPRERTVGSMGGGLLDWLIRGDNRVKLSSTEHLDATKFWTAVASEIGSLGVEDGQGLIFIHGSQTKFSDAARRTAQLKVDLGHKGPSAFFSWPSVGDAAAYAGDEAAIEGSELAIRDFLVTFAERSGLAAVHIVAHSMGNRGLLRAMDAIAKAAAALAPIRFGQVFLAAPDVDTQLFLNLASAYRQLCTRTTLYVTSNDKALGLSHWIHRSPRVGLAPPVAVLPGIDTINASHINLGLVGHGYTAETRPVLADIHHLIQSDTPPDRRFGLRRVSGADPYWEFAP